MFQSKHGNGFFSPTRNVSGWVQDPVTFQRLFLLLFYPQTQTLSPEGESQEEEHVLQQCHCYQLLSVTLVSPDVTVQINYAINKIECDAVCFIHTSEGYSVIGVTTNDHHHAGTEFVCWNMKYFMAWGCCLFINKTYGFNFEKLLTIDYTHPGRIYLPFCTQMMWKVRLEAMLNYIIISRQIWMEISSQHFSFSQGLLPKV